MSLYESAARGCDPRQRITMMVGPEAHLAAMLSGSRTEVTRICADSSRFPVRDPGDSPIIMHLEPCTSGHQRIWGKG